MSKERKALLLAQVAATGFLGNIVSRAFQLHDLQLIIVSCIAAALVLVSFWMVFRLP